MHLEEERRKKEKEKTPQQIHFLVSSLKTVTVQ